MVAGSVFTPKKKISALHLLTFDTSVNKLRCPAEPNQAGKICRLKENMSVKNPKSSLTARQPDSTAAENILSNLRTFHLVFNKLLQRYSLNTCICNKQNA
jgi:hypothetical protein